MTAPEFYGLDTFRAELEAAGWRIAINNLRGEHNRCNWYAWARDNSITPDCASNEKAPSLVALPYQAVFNDREAIGVTLEICGRAGDDDWLKLQVYTLSPADFLARYPACRARLAAAWRAAAACEA